MWLTAIFDATELELEMRTNRGRVCALHSNHSNTADCSCHRGIRPWFVNGNFKLLNFKTDFFYAQIKICVAYRPLSANLKLSTVGTIPNKRLPSSCIELFIYKN